jgi:hypothetical protein
LWRVDGVAPTKTKQIGRGRHARIIFDFAFDAPLLKQLLAMDEQIAEEWIKQPKTRINFDKLSMEQIDQLRQLAKAAREAGALK